MPLAESVLLTSCAWCKTWCNGCSVPLRVGCHYAWLLHGSWARILIRSIFGWIRVNPLFSGWLLQPGFYRIQGISQNGGFPARFWKERYQCDPMCSPGIARDRWPRQTLNTRPVSWWELSKTYSHSKLQSGDWSKPITPWYTIFFFGMTPHLSAMLQCWCDQKDTKLPSDRGKYGMQYQALAVANVWTHSWGCLKISDLHFRWLIGWLSFSPWIVLGQTVEGFDEIRFCLWKKQAIVTLHCMDKQEYAGHLCDDPKAPVLGIAIGMGHSCFWIPSQFWLLSSYKLNFVHIFPAIVVIVAYYIIYPLAV